MSARSPRADAQRNIDALLTAARTVFARDGVDAHVKVIADEAGVGVATLYRHFPKRSDLVLAVLSHEVTECIAAAPVLAEAHPPLLAMTKWVHRYTEFVATKRGLAAALHSGDPTFEGLGTRLLQRLEPALAGLLDTAKESGEIRPDVSADDLLRAVAHLCVPGPGEDMTFSRRMVDLLLDGLDHRTRP
ncbi:TetR/AcrR family transcriptional regulator [Amycolatopsis sp. GM8]|uniref:TetR/AcrR family transcriptional regulator n=1 Tax=Amycolatopsis sp. GM8 TaxID=2896530 RepID=UPI001F31192B|nr:TetR/AcrR family transcriptional regulator [Amycolatopsis sp. GM8]